MNLEYPMNRRQWLGAASAAAFLPFSQEACAASEAKEGREFCTFTKPLQDLSFEESSRIVAEAGYDGVEAPVRSGGHVLPEKIEEDLPLLIAALKKHQLSMTLLTSGINEVSEAQHTTKVLKTAAALGVRRFRMAYYQYDLAKPIGPQLDEFGARLTDLVALSSELGIKPIYQNHSGRNYFGAPLWDLYEVFSQFQPEQIGIAFDIGHATVEGAKAWPLNFARVKDFVDTIYIKEPTWNNNQLGWGPVGSGVLDKGFFKLLNQIEFAGPISVHVEYLERRVNEVIPALRENLATVKKLLS